jgi:hypothetical protein
LYGQAGVAVADCFIADSIEERDAMWVRVLLAMPH